MSEHYDYSHEDIVDVVDDIEVVIMEGLLIWMDMTERLIEDSVHDTDCDGKCSTGVVDAIIKVNRDHLDRVVESFRTALIEIVTIKDELTSDASKEIDND